MDPWSSVYMNFILLLVVFVTFPTHNLVSANYCEWDHCETDQYCCGDNLCCDYVYSLWYFWVGIVFVVLLLSACGGLLRYTTQNNYTLVSNVQSMENIKQHDRECDLEAQMSYPYYDQGYPSVPHGSPPPYSPSTASSHKH